MSTLVILPGGFHPYHAGHYALYQSAKKQFPNSDVYVAATNDQSERPFPFSIKEKLAKLAGVEPGHFIQVKSPFQAKEITQNYDPDKDVLVFVRSEKDRNEQPKPGGTKKDGSPAYFQPWTGKNLQPFSKHAYMAYLPTVEFGPGITSATQIRKAWPTLNDKRKLALVMSLYPATQKNPKLAQTVVGMFDAVMGGQVAEDISRRGFLRGLGAAAVAGAAGSAMAQSKPTDISTELARMTKDDPRIQHNKDIDELARAIYERMVAERGQPIDHRQQQQWLEIARTHAEQKFAKYAPGRPSSTKQSSGFPSQSSEYRRSRNIDNFESVEQDVAEDKSKVIAQTTNDLTNPPKIMQHRSKRDKEREETYRNAQLGRDDLDSDEDVELQQLMRKAQQHYPNMPGKQKAFVKFVQRALKHSEEEDTQQDQEIKNIKSVINDLSSDQHDIKMAINDLNSKLSESQDYLDEK